MQTINILFKENMDNEITIYWSNRSSKEKGNVTVKTKHNKQYYNKHVYISLGCATKETAYKMKRYIQWIDLNDLIPCERRDVLASLNGSRKGDYRIPTLFDHTTQYRRIGDRDPILTLTEPYDHVDKAKFQEYADHYKLSCKIYDPSTKSLWYPNSTNMIFYWKPNRFDFDELKLMGHPDSEYIC
jgi:hypothetical protein